MTRRRATDWLFLVLLAGCSDSGGESAGAGSDARMTPQTDGQAKADTGAQTSPDAASSGSPDASMSAGDAAPDAMPGGVGLSGQYPGDRGIGSDPSVIFHSDFEQDFNGWSSHTSNAALLAVDSNASLANGGSKYLRASVSRTNLLATQYISANAQFEFPERVPLAYWRFYARFVGKSAPPHHWVRLGAGNASYQSDGLANTKPAGDQGFWFDLDAHDDGRFNFYVYWYQMRSGRCNDGSTTPGCAGDQGTTYFYGNEFNPDKQAPFPRDSWICLEIMTKANTVGQKDGELALYRDDTLVGEYKTGTPRGRWLRASFYTWGQYFIDEAPFEGFDFRSSDAVAIKRITLDAYYEKGSLDARIANGLDAPETQTILYDDVVVATKRIGCKTK